MKILFDFGAKVLLGCQCKLNKKKKETEKSEILWI